jgi:hypothetical protein
MEVLEPTPGTSANNESDTNADTCCLGTNFIILSRSTRTADVYSYDTSVEPIHNVPIVTGATAWTDSNTSITYILCFHESLYYGRKLDHSLINPNQIRHNGIHFWDNPFDKEHDLCIDNDNGLHIPLNYQGTKLIFKTRAPTNRELHECIHIDMTSAHFWEPHGIKLGATHTMNIIQMNRFINKISSDYYISHPYSHTTIHTYDYKCDDTDTILHSMEPCLIQMKELMLQQLGSYDILHEEQIPARRTHINNERHNKLSADTIAELWGIGPKKAKATLRATTQHGIRSAILPLSRRYKADRMYNMKRLQGRFATDTFFSDIKSMHNDTCAQIYSHKTGFAVCYPMKSATGDSIGFSLQDFVHDFGVPEHLTFDGAQAQVGQYTRFMQNIRKYNIRHHVSSPRRPNENPAEAQIREVKKRWYRIMRKKNVPKRLWDYGIIWICETGNITVSSSRYANGRTPLEIMTGETPDITEYLDFGFYDFVEYRTNAGLGENSLGRWLGVSHKVGQLMSYWILTYSGHIISATTVQKVPHAVTIRPDMIEQMRNFDTNIQKRLNAQNTELKMEGIPDWNRLSIDECDEAFIEEFQKVISDRSIPDADEDKSLPQYDGYIDMELGLPHGSDGNLIHATVKRRALDVDGNPIGKAHKNPLLDTRAYEIEYIDGHQETLTANIIAENLLSQVDAEGHRQIILDEIIDHRTTRNAISKANGYYKTRQGIPRKKITTRGWEICVLWKDGSTNWVSLKDLKHSYPVELADYATINNIANEPAFAWWVPFVRKKRASILSKLKSKYWQRTHKYGIRIPKSVQEAYDIDKAENTTLWRDAIAQEMVKIREALTLHGDDPSDLIGYQEITTHFIFDIKLGENFRRKARLVADGHKTDTPASITYSSVVARDSVRICLLLAALNDLDIQSGDIENAYLTAPCRERCWTRAGPEFGHEQGKIFIVTQALYGLKSSGAAFRAFLAETLDKIGFKSSIADPDVWLRAATKPDGEEYYEYILCYVDDILSISHDAKATMKAIERDFKFKKNEIAPPEIYLGARLEEKRLNGRNVWTMTSKDYVKAAIENVEKRASKRNMKLPSRADTPMASNYQHDTDNSPELDTDGITFFQENIGILRWACEIGRVDILTEISMLASYQASPREGHLEQTLHIFAYLKKNPKLTLYFDPDRPIMDPMMFNGNSATTFREIYRDAKEDVPDNAPRARGRAVKITTFVDASHAADKRTRKSHTGYIIFINRAPIIWYSKRQSTIESSTFSSEFIAMKTCMESIIALRYKLRMFGVEIDGPADVLCDNASVVNNSSKIESVLNRKHNSIAYHAVRWAVAAGIMRVGKVDTNENISDAMTKRLTVAKRKHLFGNWTY